MKLSALFLIPLVFSMELPVCDVVAEQAAVKANNSGAFLKSVAGCQSFLFTNDLKEVCYGVGALKAYIANDLQAFKNSTIGCKDCDPCPFKSRPFFGYAAPLGLVCKVALAEQAIRNKDPVSFSKFMAGCGDRLPFSL
ncbi:hypothetical protein BC833DRAFT_563843 [Globomyces pollinis-pini]|nr:hypothetical protein BC833DRAFT_563843 [Globomyces pollinis-pini]KAJ2999822.1 hypothetical protein HDV02_001600 [Globomyces sp. JEL0801]